MSIFICSDHAGFELKETLIQFLTDKGFEVVDKGAFDYDSTDDYPDFVKKVAEEISENPDTAKGIIIGGTGQGEAMMANKFPRVRAALWYGGSEEILRLSKEHNNANVLSLGARFTTHEEALGGVKLWLDTSFPGDERHIRRISKFPNNQQV